jgi:hypothetical protein
VHREEVGRLEVAVDDARLVDGVDRAEHLLPVRAQADEVGLARRAAAAAAVAAAAAAAAQAVAVVGLAVALVRVRVRLNLT